MVEFGAAVDTCNSPPGVLVRRGFPVYLWGFSAIDAYLGRFPAGETLALTGADTADLARVFEELRYPGIDLADAAVDWEEGVCYFRCAELSGGSAGGGAFFTNAGIFPSGDGRRPSFGFLEFYMDCRTGHFIDPKGNYFLLRQCLKEAQPDLRTDNINPGIERCRALMDWALILARYFPLDETRLRGADLFSELAEGPAPGIEEQRLLLTGILTSRNPGAGLEFLKDNGFIHDYWPELAVLDDVDHSKEFHPEGNVWRHTLETFRYRKASGGGIYDLRLSLGLLLHDIGKPMAETTGSRRFDGHAEIGERQARRFLERLEFPAALISDVCYLVRNHMFPAALPRLPLIRTEERMSSPLFPVLMELYRCDESSSFKGLDAYYESSAAYQAYLRHRRNPYRTADGKKLGNNRKPYVR
ncbi:MAG TPA: phosphohydrolase [Treponema sp.]|nr:phosphohydrolase [Treponema sp.]